MVIKMKIDLPVNQEEFKSRVTTLREKLNKSQIDGNLPDGFEEELEKLLQAEGELLTGLIPYYRVYAKNIKKTAMRISPIKQLGAFCFDSFLHTMLRINNNLFIASSIDRKVQFFSIDLPEDFSDQKQIEGEWSPPVKEIKETISFLYQLSDKEILLLGVRGGCYLLSSDHFDHLPDVDEQINVKRIPTDHDFDGFGRCIAIREGLFVVENGEEALGLLELVKEKEGYQLVFHKEIECTIPEWTTMGKIEDNYFAVGTKTGRLYFIKYENDQLMITEEMDLLEDEIRQIQCLEEENGRAKSLIVTGNQGQLTILSINGASKAIKNEWKDWQGNLFEVRSEKGTAVILSEDRILYLLEENFGEWYQKKEAAVKDSDFTNMIALENSKYLLMDIEGKLNMLYIDRINTPNDLWNLPLYR